LLGTETVRIEDAVPPTTMDTVDGAKLGVRTNEKEDRVIEPAKPLLLPSEIEALDAPPGAIVSELSPAAMEKSGPVTMRLIDAEWDSSHPLDA
jgi:hypothetical protein